MIERAQQNQQAGWTILNESGIIQAWESIGACVNVVGSLKSGLMAKNRDIDLHIYTDQLNISDSFSVIQTLAEQLSLKEVLYRNLINTEEECIEWHALYEDECMNVWKLDMIHIRRGSKYDGMVERVTTAISDRITPDLRDTILQIKFEVPDGVMVPSIEIYYAVFDGGVRSYNQFEEWRKIHPQINSFEWVPKQGL